MVDFIKRALASGIILPKEKAISSIKLAKNRVKELLEKDESNIAHDMIQNMILAFNKWGYYDLIPEVTPLIEKITSYVYNKPKGDGDPLPPFTDEGKTLFFEFFQRTNIPEEIFDHPQLEKLIIRGDPRFQRGFPLKIPDKFDRLPNLRELYLNYMDLAPLPESISRLAKLEYLSLHHGIIREIPSWIGKLKSLKELDITCGGFNSLPLSIGDLILLEKLYISSTQISTKIPSTLCNLTELKELYAEEISINLFDPCILQLNNLKILIIGHRLDKISTSYNELFKELKKNGTKIRVPIETLFPARFHGEFKDLIQMYESYVDPTREDLKELTRSFLKFNGIGH